MEKVNGSPVYWLGHSIGQLQSRLFNPPVTIGSIADIALTCRNNLGYLVAEGEQTLPLSRGSAINVIENLNKMCTPERMQQLNFSIPEAEIYLLNGLLFSFQAVFLSEASSLNIFYVTPKRAYDMSRLITQGEHILSQACLNSLGQSKSMVISDIREATKCLAFDIPTAVGFHIYRAIEAIITQDYFPVLNIQSSDWDRNKNLGNYISLLESKGVDVKVTTILRHLKDHYRNPISHPEEFWGIENAESAFMLATSVISVLLQDIQKRKGTLTTT
jgi:hypothetical protein